MKRKLEGEDRKRLAKRRRQKKPIPLTLETPRRSKASPGKHSPKKTDSAPARGANDTTRGAGTRNSPPAREETSLSRNSLPALCIRTSRMRGRSKFLTAHCTAQLLHSSTPLRTVTYSDSRYLSTTCPPGGLWQMTTQVSLEGRFMLVS